MDDLKKGMIFMDRKYFENLLNFYEKELDQTLNFWYDHGYDHEHGGFYVCLQRNGELFGTDKSVWAQGRGLWVFSKAYNDIKKDPRYLQIAKDAFEFIKNHCYDKDGRMWFTVTDDGRGIQKRRYWFSETFAVVGSVELYKATNDKKYLKLARETYDSVMRLYLNPNLSVPKYNPDVIKDKGLAGPMILMVTSQIMRDIDKENADKYNSNIDIFLNVILNHHLHPEYKAMFENVGMNGEIVSGPRGRLVNPGHSIEASWFLMNEALYRNDKEILNKALDILNWSFDIGWDKEYDGLMYFADIEHKPCEALEWDMKLWWPHNEMLIAFLKAYAITGEEKYLDKYKLVHEYAFSHFKDEKYGEWYGYLHRDGSVANDLKGNIFKGPFHLPRCLMENVLQIKEILKNGNK